jgi:hypothetical protein
VPITALDSSSRLKTQRMRENYFFVIKGVEFTARSSVTKIMVGFHAPHSPYPTPLDFYFQGYVKRSMYSVHIHNIQHQKQPIREAAASVTADVLCRVWQQMECRLDVCGANNGAHTELR